MSTLEDEAIEQLKSAIKGTIDLESITLSDDQLTTIVDHIVSQTLDWMGDVNKESQQKRGFMISVALMAALTENVILKEILSQHAETQDATKI